MAFTSWPASLLFLILVSPAFLLGGETASSAGFKASKSKKPTEFRGLTIQPGTVGSKPAHYLYSKEDDVLLVNVGRASSRIDASKMCAKFKPKKDCDLSWRLPDQSEVFSIFVFAKATNYGLMVSIGKESKHLEVIWSRYPNFPKVEALLKKNPSLVSAPLRRNEDDLPPPPYRMWPLKEGTAELEKIVRRLKNLDRDEFKSSVELYEKLIAELKKGVPVFCLAGDFAE